MEVYLYNINGSGFFIGSCQTITNSRSALLLLCARVTAPSPAPAGMAGHCMSSRTPAPLWAPPYRRQSSRTEKITREKRKKKIREEKGCDPPVATRSVAGVLADRNLREKREERGL